MKIATLLFTYNRSQHTQQVLDALSRNSVLPEKLFIFHDGLKCEEDFDEWSKVNKLVRGMNKCNTEIIESSHNKGLAVSIVSGVSYAFEEYDAVIVLEDDCVPTVGFVSYMIQCFEKYERDKRVYSITGYSFPAGLKKGTYDVYGGGRISSWGWGTWKDRWEKYQKDYELIKKMKQEERASKNLAIWGSDLENTLVGNVEGECDSWAVFWALKVIEKEGICINPYKSLIKNIGFDGSGIHCGATDIWDVKAIEDEKTVFHLPNEVAISNEIIEAYIPMFGQYTAINEDNGIKEKVLVYGAGNFYQQKEQQICEKYFVQAFIDRKKKGWLAGKQVIKEKDINRYEYDWILVMISDSQECMKVVKELAKQKVDPQKILTGHDL